MKKSLTKRQVVILVIGVLCIFSMVYFVISEGTFCDSWWLIPLGEYIVQHKSLPSTNIWVMHDNFKIICQQWVSSLINYAWYFITGKDMSTQAYLGLIYLAIHTMAAHLYAKEYTKNKVTAFTVAAICSIFAFHISCARPAFLTSALFYVELTILTRYYINKTISYKKLVISLAIISIIQVNIQAAAWMFVMVLTLPFIAPCIWKKHWLKNLEYDKISRGLVNILVIILAGLINPYGYKAELYLYYSRTVSKLVQIYENNRISYLAENYPLRYTFIDFKLLIIMLVILVWGCTKGIIKEQNTYLSIGTLLVATLQVRQSCMMPYGLVQMICYLIDSYLDKDDENANRITSPVVVGTYSVGILAIVIVMFSKTIITEADKITCNGLPEAVTYLNDDIESEKLDKEKVKVYASNKAAVYLQYYGFKTYHDGRNEVIDADISGYSGRVIINNEEEEVYDCLEEETLIEYNICINDKYVEDFLNYYDFDYVVVGKRNIYAYIKRHPEQWESVELDIDDTVSSPFYTFKRIR